MRCCAALPRTREMRALDGGSAGGAGGAGGAGAGMVEVVFYYSQKVKEVKREHAGRGQSGVKRL